MFKVSRSLKINVSPSLRMTLPNLPSKGIFAVGQNHTGYSAVNPIIGWIHADTGKALMLMPNKYESYDDTSKFIVEFDKYANHVVVKELSQGQTASNTVDLKHLEAVDFFLQNQWTKTHHIPHTQTEYDAFVAKTEANKVRARELVADMMAKEGVDEATSDMRFAAFAATNDLCSEDDLATIYDKVEGSNIRKLDQLMVNYNRDLEKYEDKQIWRRTYGQQHDDVHNLYINNRFNRKALEFAKEYDSNAEDNLLKYQHDPYMYKVDQMPRDGRPDPMTMADDGSCEMYPRQGESFWQALDREYQVYNNMKDYESARLIRFVAFFSVGLALYISCTMEEIEIHHDHHADMIAEAKKNGCYTKFGIF